MFLKVSLAYINFRTLQNNIFDKSECQVFFVDLKVNKKSENNTTVIALLVGLSVLLTLCLVGLAFYHFCATRRREKKSLTCRILTVLRRWCNV